jgi:hypothetical protein
MAAWQLSARDKAAAVDKLRRSSVPHDVRPTLPCA